MKSRHPYTALLVAALVAMVAGGCHSKEITDEMSDSTKLELLDLKLESHPDDHELLAKRAEVLFKLGRAKEANFDINHAVELKPNRPEYRLLQADICFANGDVAGSYKALEEAERLTPQSNEVQLKMGEIAFYSRNYDRAIECLSKVTKKDPNNRTALFMKGFIYKERGDTASAVQFFRRVCNKFPDYAPAFEQLGVLYAARNEKLALEYLNTALQLDPSNTNTMYALAMFYQDNKDMEHAEALYRQMLDINENSADAWHNLGWIEMTFYSDYQRAVEYFDKALAADPQHAGAQANRQVALAALGKGGTE